LRARKREGKDQAESLELTVIEHHRKNTEDEPRGVVFEHDLIGKKWLEDQELDGTS
jgi:hypothetical protein